MDAASKKVLESATLTTLHAQQFSRSSTQAHLLLTDLLSRYLTLLSSTCAKYSEHAGRLRVTEKDAVAALGELGVGVEELTEYWETEGREMARLGYVNRALRTARRQEELEDMQANLAVGLKEDRDDAIPLVYAPVEDEAFLDYDLYEEQTDSGLSSEEVDLELELDDSAMRTPEDNEPLTQQEARKPQGPILGKDILPLSRREPDRLPSPLPPGIVTPPRSPPPRPVTPLTFPPSPISNPATPPPSSPSQPSTSRRKRPRTATWSPPPHVPAFLPPFPHTSPEGSPRATPSLALPEEEPNQMHSFADALKMEHPPSPQIPPAQPSSATPATSTSADYLTAVPYSLSSLASQPAWHLPSKPYNFQAATSPSRLPIPDTQPALFGAYHHILTHPPPPIPIGTAASANLGRYKVALSLVEQNENLTNPIWEPVPSLFGTTAPNAPRVATIGPTYAVPVGKEDGSKSEKGKEKEGSDAAAEAKMPAMPTRPVASLERVAPLVSSARPRIPQLAKQLLSNPVYNRSTRLGHPPVLVRGSTKLVYGQGVPAPWNSSSLPIQPQPAKPNPKDVNAKDKSKDKDDPTAADKLLPDAQLYATWNWDQKSYKDALVVPRRGRMGSVAGSSTQIGAVPNGVGKRDRDR